MVSVLHKTSKATGKEYAVVASTAPLPKKMTAPEPFNPQVYLDYHEGWDEAVYEKLPQFIKDDMATSTEMQERVSSDKPHQMEYPEGNPDDVPF